MEARKLVGCQALFFLNKFVLLEWKQSFLYLPSATSPHTPPSELAAEQKATGTISHHSVQYNEHVSQTSCRIRYIYGNS